MDPDALDSVGRVPHGSSDDPDLLDFSANINPEVPEGAQDVYENAFDLARSYPNDRYPEFRRAAAAYADCAPDAVVPTPGGLAAIRLSIEATVGPDDSVLVPYPSFGEYAREVRLQGGVSEFVPADELLAADPTDHALAIVCNPNNPTGESYDHDGLEAFAERCVAAETTLLVDEAFLGFVRDGSLAPREGVVAARSLTKLFGLPGLRAGFAVASGNLLERLQTARPPWSLGGPAAAVGAHCMRDTAFIEHTRERVASERARMRERLGERFDVRPSDAPFLLLDVGEDPSDLVEKMRARGIELRDATTFRGLDTHIRVAVRSPDANDRLLEALDV